MEGNVLFCVFLLAQKSITASMFYHEPSYVMLRPKELSGMKEVSKKFDFGFSMGYQTGKEPYLVVGSPNVDTVGRVYKCLIDPDRRNIDCDKLDIDVEKLAKGSDKSVKNQNFCLGATIATTANYFMTCAPLWTTTGVKSCKKSSNPQELVCESHSGSYGTCFVYYNQTSVHQFRGILEQYKDVKNLQKNYAAMYGGAGWSLLADEKDKLLLLGKPFQVGDIQYVNSTGLESDEKRNSSSLSYSKWNNDDDHHDLMNIGYALASGEFFSRNISYAFSMKENYGIGKVHFLKYNRKDNLMLREKSVSISSKLAGDMYGAAMSSADVNADGFADLLVGAPAHTFMGHSESGALYVYLGGDAANINSKDRWRVILSEEPHSRFGTAIATSDIDGDSLPEIFVSAPYESEGLGALYIISGHELNHAVIKRLTTDGIVKLSELQWTQKVQIKAFRSFGFSLQVVADINDNGCNELALGAPQSSTVILLKCMPTVNATLSSRRLNEVVKTTDNNFALEVCVKVSYQEKPASISTKLQVVSKVYGKGATIKKDLFEVDLALRNESYCENVVVQMRPDEKEVYHYSAKLEYKDEALINKQEFDRTWVRMSVHSKVEASETVTRACAETDCTSNLHMRTLWSGRDTPKEYYVVEKTNENVTLLIKNDGANAYDACVRIKVRGAKERIPCPIDDKGEYMCKLPKPLARGKTYPLNFVVGIEKATNEYTLHILADLYTDCSGSNFTSTEMHVNFIFVMKNVYILESSHNVTVTDRQILNVDHPTLIDKHEYKIVNNGTLNWENVGVVIHLNKRDYIQNYIVSIKELESNCVEKNDTDEFVKFVCTGMNLHEKPLLINVRSEMSYVKIMENLKDNKLEIESKIKVIMASIVDNSKNFLEKSQITTIFYVKETSIGNNKTAIIIIVIIAAFLILAVVAFILYKIGFFKRKEKDRLDSMKASVRSKSQSTGNKPSTSGAGGLNTESKDGISLEDFDLEVIDDCPFDPMPMTTADDAALIEKEVEHVGKRTSKQDPSTSANKDAK